MITFVAILIFVIASVIGFKQSKRDKKEHEDSVTLIKAEELFRKTGVEIKEVDSNGKYTIIFQGGIFEIETSNERYIDVNYTHFAEIDEHEALKALYCSNLMNLKYKVWSCGLSINNVKEANAGKYYTSLSSRMELLGCMDEKVEQLKGLLSIAFKIEREFEDDFQNEIDDKRTVDEYFTELTFNTKQERMMLIAENLHLCNMNKEEDERMSLSSILKKLDIPLSGDIIKMKFIHNDSIIIPDNPQELMHYDICKYIRENSKDKALSKATVSLALSGQRILFCFNLIESTQRRLLYTINVLGYSEQISSDNNFSLQSLFEVKLSNEKDDYWEVKYMIDDAFDKQCANKTDELSDEQRMILKNVVPGINADLYWGKKYFNRKCYFQSLKHFIRAFEHLRSEWLNINDNAKDVYAKLGLYIGTIYMELGQFEKAHYYLDIASNFKASIGGITEFTNCLCNMNDPFALNYIDNTIKRISEIINNSEDGNEHLEGLLDFLFRRMAFTLINHKDYDTAERILKDMIKNERNVDFANNELAYIQKVKEENSSSDEENTSR